ncbi:MAG: methyltransferase domain-containing protein [Burkholderiaceae bacterium]|nr:methyltransferase domain-containing protein [Burkholderiaceae bacterium]
MDSAPIKLERVVSLFSTPEKVSTSTFLRREIAQRMREKLELVNIEPSAVLDAGCGEGDDFAPLSEHFPKAQIIGLDAAPAMLRLASQRQRELGGALDRLFAKFTRKWNGANKPPQLMCADFAKTPLADGSVDVVWSNLALHWHPRPDEVFAEWHRILRKDGLLMFSCFGPDSLIEVRKAFAAVDDHHHCLPFVDMHDFGDMLVKAGFSSPVMDMEKLTLTYADSEQLLSEVRSLGGNPLDSRSRGLLGRAGYRRLKNAFEAQRNTENRLPLTIEVIYGHAFRPTARKLGSGEAIVRFDRPKK